MYNHVINWFLLIKVFGFDLKILYLEDSMKRCCVELYIYRVRESSKRMSFNE